MTTPNAERHHVGISTDAVLDGVAGKVGIVHLGGRLVGGLNTASSSEQGRYGDQEG